MESKKSYAGSQRTSIIHLSNRKVYFGLTRNLTEKGKHIIEGSVTWGSSGFDFIYQVNGVKNKRLTNKIIPHNEKCDLTPSQQADVVKAIVDEGNKNIGSTPTGRPIYTPPCVKAMPLSRKLKIQTTARAMLKHQTHFTNDFIVFILKHHLAGLGCSK